MKKVYVVRHGLTDWNLIPKVQGMTDIPLNESGKKQAQYLAKKIKESGLKFQKILYSPLKRAEETARQISILNEIPMEVELRLIEQNFGKWEGCSPSSGDNSFHLAKQQFMDNYETGESMMKVGQRVYNLLDEIKKCPGDSLYLLVTHGGIGRVIHSYFNDLTNEEFAAFQLENCEIREYVF